MAWITLSNTDLKGVLSGAEYNSITTAVLNEGQTGEALAAEEISKTVELVRGFCGRGTLGLAGTIPSELKDAALHILRVNILIRLPLNKTILTEQRVMAKEDAMRLLRDVASGKFHIVRPEESAPDNQQAAASSIKTVCAQPKRFTRKGMRGLWG